MTPEELLEIEGQSQKGAVLVDSAVVAGVTLIIYDTDPFTMPPPSKSEMYVRRWAVHSEEGGRTGGTVKTEFKETNA